MTAAPDLPLLHRGKVREMYDLGDDLLMVASDRISTYDVVHPNPIPDKGKVLTGLSVLWFGLTDDIVPNHMISATDGVPEELRGRALRVRRLKMVPVECVVRGYITGSGWKDYQATARRRGGSQAVTIPHSCSVPSGAVSKKRPPTRASRTAGPPLTECVSNGHQRSRPSVNSAKASSGGRATVTETRMGSVMAGLPPP